jgi:hypothetical protein
MKIPTKSWVGVEVPWLVLQPVLVAVCGQVAEFRSRYATA